MLTTRSIAFVVFEKKQSDPVYMMPIEFEKKMKKFHFGHPS